MIFIAKKKLQICGHGCESTAICFYLKKKISFGLDICKDAEKNICQVVSHKFSKQLIRFNGGMRMQQNWINLLQFRHFCDQTANWFQKNL